MAVSAKEDLRDHVRTPAERQSGDHVYGGLSRCTRESCPSRFLRVAEGVAHRAFEDNVRRSEWRPSRNLINNAVVTLGPMVRCTAIYGCTAKKGMVRGLDDLPLGAFWVLGWIVEAIA